MTSLPDSMIYCPVLLTDDSNVVRPKRPRLLSLVYVIGRKRRTSLEPPKARSPVMLHVLPLITIDVNMMIAGKFAAFINAR